MKTSKRLLAVLTAAVAIPSAGNAATVVLNANLTGAQEFPPVATPGAGVATVTFDDATNLLTVQASFANLLGNTSAAHIHCCTLPGANAGVATPVPSFPGFPTGVTAGSYLRTFDLTQAASYNPAFVTANGGTVESARQVFVGGLLSGRTYFNVHTSLFPGGEIRGQLAAVPEPATWAMMLLGFGAVGFSLRRRPMEAALTA